VVAASRGWPARGAGPRTAPEAPPAGRAPAKRALLDHVRGVFGRVQLGARRKTPRRYRLPCGPDGRVNAKPYGTLRHSPHLALTILPGQSAGHRRPGACRAGRAMDDRTRSNEDSVWDTQRTLEPWSAGMEMWARRSGSASALGVPTHADHSRGATHPAFGVR
jgi:hypothetical protein